MVLTSKQKQELNLAIHEYLKNQNFVETADLFKIEADVNFIKN